MEFYVSRIPLSSPSVLRRTLVNPLEMLSGGRASCVNAVPAGPHPLPDLCTETQPHSRWQGADLWQEAGWMMLLAWRKAVSLVGLRYPGNLVSGL